MLWKTSLKWNRHARTWKTRVTLTGFSVPLIPNTLIAHMVFNAGMSDPRAILLSALILVAVSAL
jgi:hypothetical protein